MIALEIDIDDVLCIETIVEVQVMPELDIDDD
jgi:hypothetical protein